VIGDLNADGKPDLATDGVSVLLGNGDGSFGAVTDYAAGNGPRSVAIGDLNGDGKPDLAVANYGTSAAHGSTVSVLLGNGDGTFGRSAEFGAGDGARFVAIGDLNGDGKPDLVVANLGFYPAYGTTVSLLLGNGDGTFQSKTDLVTGSGPYSLAIGDLNGDGRPDLVTANFGSCTVSVLLGNGDGTFGAKTDYYWADCPAFPAISDLNGDGKPDLVVMNWDGHLVSVLLGNGDGTFGDRIDHGTMGGYLQSMAVGDLNSDGKPDVAIANWGFGGVNVLLGHGDGGFEERADLRTNGGSFGVAIGDLDGDRKLDLAATNGLNTVSVLPGNGDGTFGAKTDYGTGSQPYAVAIGDLNGDGRPDVVTANSGSNTVSVLLNVAPGFPTPIALSLLDAHATPDRVDLSWFGASMAAVPATVYRQSAGAPWAPIATLTGDGTGTLRFVDRDVQPGARYGYRLGVREGPGEQFYGETWITVPAWKFALAPPAPNPARDRLSVALTLPGAAAARLEVIDVAGRVVARRDVGALGPGPHTVAFAEAAGWRPGIYLVRLTQGARMLTTRACIVR